MKPTAVILRTSFALLFLSWIVISGPRAHGQESAFITAFSEMEEAFTEMEQILGFKSVETKVLGPEAATSLAGNLSASSILSAAISGHVTDSLMINRWTAINSLGQTKLLAYYNSLASSLAESSKSNKLFSAIGQLESLPKRRDQWIGTPEAKKLKSNIASLKLQINECKRLSNWADSRPQETQPDIIKRALFDSNLSLLMHRVDSVKRLYDEREIYDSIPPSPFPLGNMWNMLPESDFFEVWRTKNGFGIGYIPYDGNALISEMDLKQLQEGRALPNKHPLTKLIARHSANGQALVLHVDPKLKPEDPLVRDADTVAFAMQKAYPHARVYRDPLSAQTKERVSSLNEFMVKGPDDLMLVVAPESFRVPTGNLIANIEQDLPKSITTIVKFCPGNLAKYKWQRHKCLIVITGHASDDLTDFVVEMGKTGYFRDNFVLFNSCETPLTRSTITEINEKYGAAATFAYEGTIPGDAVGDFLVEVTQTLVKKDGIKRQFVDVVNASLQHHNLNGLWTICLNSQWLNPDTHLTGGSLCLK